MLFSKVNNIIIQLKSIIIITIFNYSEVLIAIDQLLLIVVLNALRKLN